MELVVAYFIVIIVFVVTEASWLFAMKPFYAAQFATFARSPLGLYDVAAAASVYVLLAASFWFFVLADIHRVKTALDAFLRGAFFGLAVYGVYNLTNRSTLLGYGWPMVAVDTLWGSALYGILAVVFFGALPQSPGPAI